MATPWAGTCASAERSCAPTPPECPATATAVSRACAARRSPSSPGSAPTTTSAWSKAATGTPPTRCCWPSPGLQLDEDATAYLLQLAKPPHPRSKRTRRPEKVSDGIRTLIASWPLTPAYVHGRYMDILAANTLATALCPFITAGRNAILDAFTEPEMRQLRPDWDAMTARAVPHLRSIAGADTGDPRLVELVGELSLRSERFRTLWARQDVKHKSTGTSLFNHPQVGPLALNYERLLIPGSNMQALVTYHAQPGSDSEERLCLLASITTPTANGRRRKLRPRP